MGQDDRTQGEPGPPSADDDRTRGADSLGAWPPVPPAAPTVAATRWDGTPQAPPTAPAGDATWMAPSRGDARPEPAQPQRLPPFQPRPGARLAGYELERELGRGGMGAVFLAREVASGREVALKLVLDLVSASPLARARFVREGEVAAGLEHPGIVRVHAAGEDQGVPWLACELVPGARSLISAARALPREAGVGLVRDAARALGHAHRRGVVHRDVKPDNLLVGADGRVRVTDFGLAMAQDQGRLTRSGAVIGTPAWMAPEQVDGQRAAVGPPTDVWALGVVLYELLTGQRPFEGSSAAELAVRIVQGQLRRPRDVASDVSPALEAVILRALRDAPADRWADGDAMADALDEALAGRRVEAPRPPPPRPRRLALVAAVAGLLAAGAAVVAGLALRQEPPPSPGTPRRTTTTQRPGPAPVVAEAPAWLELIPAAERPPWPLPQGLVLGARRGEFTNEKDGSVLLWVPPATFIMGGDDLLASDTQQAGGTSASKHQVTLTRGYFIGKHEVTWSQLERFCDETGAERPAKPLTRRSVPGLLPGQDEWVDLPGPPFVPGAEHPCMRVKWELAVAYCAWAGLRLPTEAEWELAARGKDPTRRFPWGADPPPDAAHLNWGGDADGYPFTSPVGRFPEGVAPSGCLDMGGNVSEFCSDWMGTLGPEPVTDPVGPPTGERRVYRGGSWVNTFADAFATHFRSGSGPTHMDPQHGFRAARSSADP